ncbi:MAG: DoxX family protein [Polyangiaceae bacterium]
MRWVMTTSMVVMGVLHFVVDDVFAQIIPPWMPWPHGLVWISGVFEIALGLALIPERTRRLAGWGLVALYIAVFPANIYMAVANVHIEGHEPLPPAFLWGRLPFQFVFIAWALWVTKPSRPVTASASPVTS